jgi:hypothetical protein
VTAVSPEAAARSVFDNRDRERALARLDAIDNLGAERLFDALWPSDDDKRRVSANLRSGDRTAPAAVPMPNS